MLSVNHPPPRFPPQVLGFFISLPVMFYLEGYHWADFVKLCTTAVVADKKKGIVAYDPWPLQYNTWLEVAPNYYTTLLYY